MEEERNQLVDSNEFFVELLKTIIGAIKENLIEETIDINFFEIVKKKVNEHKNKTKINSQATLEEILKINEIMFRSSYSSNSFINKQHQAIKTDSIIVTPLKLKKDHFSSAKASERYNHLEESQLEDKSDYKMNENKAEIFNYPVLPDRVARACNEITSFINETQRQIYFENDELLKEKVNFKIIF